MRLYLRVNFGDALHERFPIRLGGFPAGAETHGLRGHSFSVEIFVAGECDRNLAGHGLRRHHCGVQADLGKAGSLLFERNSRSRKSDERKCRGLDLEKVEAKTATTHGNRHGRNLHRAGGLSRGRMSDGSVSAWVCFYFSPPARGLRSSGNARKHNQETLIKSIWQSNKYSTA